MITGYQSEEIFFKLIKSLGIDIKRSTLNEDRFNHIDFFINGLSYDVKTIKGLNSKGIKTDNIIWLEFMNVRGNDGWLKSNKLNKIAFMREDGYYIIDRKDLLNRAKELVANVPPVNYKAYRLPYRRYGRLDIVAYVYFEDVKDLVEKIYYLNK